MTDQTPPPTPQPLRSAEDALEAARAVVDRLSDRQASNIVLLDVRGLTTVADYFVVASAESIRQLGALRDNVDELLARSGVAAFRSEGLPDSGWVLLDYGSLVVHLFDEEQRGFYQLDRVWDRAPALLRIQ